MIKHFFNYLLIGALHKQRGDSSNIYFSRASLWVSLSTSCYLTSAFKWMQYYFTTELNADGILSYKDFHNEYLITFILTISLMVTFLFVFWPNIIDEFKSKRNGWHYSVFLMYFLPSFVVFAYTNAFLYGY